MKMKIGLLFLFVLFSGFSPTFQKVLIIGDSISIGYFSFVENELNKKAIAGLKQNNAILFSLTGDCGILAVFTKTYSNPALNRKNLHRRFIHLKNMEKILILWSAF